MRRLFWYKAVTGGVPGGDPGGTKVTLLKAESKPVSREAKAVTTVFPVACQRVADAPGPPLKSDAWSSVFDWSV